jgi:hypothetical protein
VTYWVGGVLDADGVLAEQNESNNATYRKRRSGPQPSLTW